MRHTITITLALLLGSLTLNAQQFKVGTFDSRGVALAFYNSEYWAGVLKAKRAELESEKRAGNKEKVAELEKWGQGQQDLAHQQVFGSAPIPNVLEHLAPAFPEIAKAAAVPVIVSDVRYADSSVQKVDVTMHILDWLKSSDRTRAMVKSLKNVPPSEGPHQH
jgi:hypothetical protein